MYKIGQTVSYASNSSFDLTVADPYAYSGICTERIKSFSEQRGEITEIESFNGKTILTLTLTEYPFTDQIDAKTVIN